MKVCNEEVNMHLMVKIKESIVHVPAVYRENVFLGMK